jgi:hypothetical protein
MIQLQELLRGILESYNGRGCLLSQEFSSEAHAVPIGSLAEAERDLIAPALESTDRK